MPFIALLSLLLIATVAEARTDINAADTAWIMTASALVLLMTLPGLALFYGGLVRYKNVVSVVSQCLGIAAAMTLLWTVIGYTLTFSGEDPFIGNLDHLLLLGIQLDSLTGTIPEALFVLFQGTFAIITPALVVGAYVERMKYSAVLLFSSLWLIAVYAPVAHWIWGGGFLATMGALDFAGGMVVHATAGVAAVVLAMRLGKRVGFLSYGFPPVSPVLTAVGAGLLWVGWFGFNGGSALAANSQAAMAILVTHIAAATGTLTWIALDWYFIKKFSLVAAVTGTIAGLATVTPASGFIGVPGAILLGLIGGVSCYFAVQLVRGKWHLDDSLDVMAVHGVGGIIGSLLLAVFMTEAFGGQGLGNEISISDQLMVQAISIAVVCAYTAIVSYVLVVIVEKTVGLRASESAEEIGLDSAEHNESAARIR